MKKIMFNDRFGLTEAVIEKRKTVTRRLIACPRKAKGVEVFGYYVCTNKDGVIVEIAPYDADERTIDGGAIMPPYKVGEIVAVAQRYSSFIKPSDWDAVDKLADSKGWNNKMFVCAGLMPHQIRILDVRAERLQDITDEDCLREGVERLTWQEGYKHYCPEQRFDRKLLREGAPFCSTARVSFSTLIDKISGRGTWERNPYVWRIEFELIK